MRILRLVVRTNGLVSVATLVYTPVICLNTYKGETSPVTGIGLCEWAQPTPLRGERQANLSDKNFPTFNKHRDRLHIQSQKKLRRAVLHDLVSCTLEAMSECVFHRE